MSDALEAVRAAFAERYDIVREVGQGGMATVYLARDRKHERHVALKLLRAELAAALGADRFTREIHIIAQLSHPHILPLHDSGEMGGLLYYVMPYVEGESLRQRLDREGPLSPHDAARILRQVTDALAYAHARGVVHRDIKPDNVMLSGRHAIVTDFGVAKAVTDAGGEKLTTVGIALGTPSYMSPEQATGATDVDHRSDIYAVGVLAYEMITGAPPFAKSTAQAILSAHVIEPPQPITEREPTVPDALGDLVMRCLEKDRDDRWQTADELLPTLETLATPSGGVTPTATRPVRTRGTAASSRRRWLPAVVAATLIVVGGLGWALWPRGAGASDGIERMAVLPIDDISGSDQAFVDAIHDALITSLAQLDLVTVVTRSAVMPYRDNPKPTQDIAADLDVDAILEGTVFRAGSRMRINVQLVEPLTIRHLWTQSYERDVRDVLAAQDSVVRQITVGITQVLAGVQHTPSSSSP